MLITRQHFPNANPTNPLKNTSWDVGFCNHLWLCTFVSSQRWYICTQIPDTAMLTNWVVSHEPMQIIPLTSVSGLPVNLDSAVAKINFCSQLTPVGCCCKIYRKENLPKKTDFQRCSIWKPSYSHYQPKGKRQCSAIASVMSSSEIRKKKEKKNKWFCPGSNWGRYAC